MDKIIIDGNVIDLDDDIASKAIHNLENAPDGDVLVAASYQGRVLVRWITKDASSNLVPKPPSARRVKVSKKTCPWLFIELENQFEQVASKNSQELVAMYDEFVEELEQRGKNPESYRRWFSKFKRRWVKTAISQGGSRENVKHAVVYP